MFYCTSHDVMEDSDFVGYHVTMEGDEVCDDAASAMYDDDPNPYAARLDSPTPNPYAGTYSED
jgi:hypothetical protein